MGHLTKSPKLPAVDRRGAAPRPGTLSYAVQPARSGWSRRWLPVLWAVLSTFALSPAPSYAENPSAPAPLREVHFSPDGQYVLAQEDARITVLIAHPLAISFRIPAQDARDT